MNSAKLRDDTSPANDTAHPIEDDPPLGPQLVRRLLHDPLRCSNLMDEAERFLSQAQMREKAHADASEAEVACGEEYPSRPAACQEQDAATGKLRELSRDEMMENARNDVGRAGKRWLTRVLAFDRWRLECLQVEIRHDLPQLQARAEQASRIATDCAWRVLDHPAASAREVAIKLGVWLAEIGDLELQEADAKPLRILCGELLTLAGPSPAP